MNHEQPISLAQVRENRLKELEPPISEEPRKRKVAAKTLAEIEADRHRLRSQLIAKGVDVNDVNGQNITNNQDRMKFVLSQLNAGKPIPSRAEMDSADYEHGMLK